MGQYRSGKHGRLRSAVYSPTDGSIGILGSHQSHRLVQKINQPTLQRWQSHPKRHFQELLSLRLAMKFDLKWVDAVPTQQQHPDGSTLTESSFTSITPHQICVQSRAEVVENLPFQNETGPLESSTIQNLTTSSIRASVAA
jgi:hypothetical protein